MEKEGGGLRATMTREEWNFCWASVIVLIFYYPDFLMQRRNTYIRRLDGIFIILKYNKHTRLS